MSQYIQVLREEEFAPVKNANGSNFDTPDSARLLVLRLHSRWVVAAGGFLTHSVPLYLTGNSLLYIVSILVVQLKHIKCIQMLKAATATGNVFSALLKVNS